MKTGSMLSDQGAKVFATPCNAGVYAKRKYKAAPEAMATGKVQFLTNLAIDIFPAFSLYAQCGKFSAHTVHVVKEYAVDAGCFCPVGICRVVVKKDRLVGL